MAAVVVKVGEPVEFTVTEKFSYSGFVSFKYNPNIVEICREVKKRKYNPQTKEWEIAGECLAKFLDDLDINNIDYHFVEKQDERMLSESFNDTEEVKDVEIPKEFHFKTQPFEHQLKAIKFGLLNNSFMLGDEQGLGKALSLDTKVYTPDGYKLMKDISVGDFVFNSYGEPVEVIATFLHKNVEMYRITFSDGSFADCCKDHLWKIHDQRQSKVVDTNWFLEKDQFGRIRKDYLFSSGSNSYKFYIERCKPVNFNEKDVPLHPYVLGALLGDGTFRAGSIGFTSMDLELVNKINYLLPDGYYLNSSKSMPDFFYNVISTGSNKVNRVKRVIEDLGLFGKNSHEKFIPDIYKYNSVQVRTFLLQGLLDTDGYANKDNLLSYTTVSKQLCEDVRFLVESLGGIVSYTTRQCGYNGKITGISYNLTIKFNSPQLYCTLSRKRSLLKDRKFKARRNIVSIEKIENADAKCITVNSRDGLYLINNFIVTHNTKSVIDLAVCRKIRDGIQHCLIICGINGNKYNWEEEVKLHSNEGAWILGTRYSKMGKPYIGTLKDRIDDLKRMPKQFFWITNVETLRLGGYKQYPRRKMSPYIYPVIEEINKLTEKGIIGMVAFDEAHKAKNPASRQGQALLKIKCDSIIPMSGTFVLNNPLDLYLPLRLVGVEDSSYYIYKNRYCILGGFNNSEVIGYRRLSELQDYLKECMLRRKKENVLDLPPKVYKTEYVELNPEQKKLYQEVREHIMTNLDGIKLSPNPLVEMQRLRQVTGYPGVISNTIIDSTKMNRLVEIVDECVLNEEKAIIFSLWTSMTEVLREKLKKYNPAYITGDVKDSVRMEEVNRFQNDPECKVIIGTVGAMGTGLTLTAASNVIFLDEPWNRGLKDQAEDRAHRIGTNGTVTVITLVTKGTIDEGINNLVQKKGKIADLLVDGVGGKITEDMVEYLVEYTGG